MYVCAHKCMGPLQYRSNIIYEMTRSYGVCLYVSTIHVYTVRHNVMCICHAQGPIGLYLRNKHKHVFLLCLFVFLVVFHFGICF